MKLYSLFAVLLTYSPLYSQDVDITRIEFQSLSRGYFESVVITLDSVIIRKTENRNSTEKVSRRTISKKQWKSLQKETSKINLAEISSLKSPTMKRAYDGARHSRLVINTSSRTYEHLFDDENPHPVLQQLMNCVIKLKN